MNKSTITFPTPHGVDSGAIVLLTVPDRRWWRRLVYWLLRRGTPYRQIRKRVSIADSGTTITLK